MKPSFCISLDMELLWGRYDLNWNKFEQDAKKTRDTVDKLLSLFEKYNIPTTWAIVGKLLEPGKDIVWSYPEILSKIEEHSIHEVASHSYSHPEFDKLSQPQAKIEIAKSIQKTNATSFIFPRNKIKHLNVLKSHGFTAYRGPDASNLELLLPRTPPVYTPHLHKGLINIPGSMYFVSSRGIRKYIPFGLRYYKSKLGIKKAIKENKVFHLWMHPIDLSQNTNRLLHEIELILKYANKKRGEGILEIVTMKTIATKWKHYQSSKI